MDQTALAYSLPAIIALICKVGIYAYAHHTGTHSLLTRLYLLFLFSLSIQNVAEINHFLTWQKGVVPDLELRMYYAASIVALAFVLHFTMVVALKRISSATQRIIIGAYLFCGLLVVLVFQGDLLIAGFAPFGYSLSRVPGPLYVLFEIYAFGIILSVISLLVYGLRRQATPRKRARCGVVLVAIVPMALLVMTVVGFLHFGIKLFNATTTNPLAITYFLAVTAYAAHRYRFFDLQFYLPFSRTRREKKAFYRRLGELGREIRSDMPVQQLLQDLSQRLGCSAALVGNNLVMASGGPDGNRLSRLPQTVLREVEELVVTEELEDVAPDMHRLLFQHGIGAVVPIYPRSRRLPGWLVLDSGFSRTVYTPRDFKVVTRLFEQISERLFDMMIVLRGRIDRGNQGLRRWVTQLNLDRNLLVEENQRLRSINARLEQERSLNPTGVLRTVTEHDPVSRIATVCTDPDLVADIRARYENAVTFKQASELVAANVPLDLALVDADRDKGLDILYQLSARLATDPGDTAWLVYGNDAAALGRALQDSAPEALVDVIPGEPGRTAMLERLHALLQLKVAIYDTSDPDNPLIGCSPAFTAFMNGARGCGDSGAPVLLQHQDPGQALAVAGWIHRNSGMRGELVVLQGQAQLNDTLVQRAQGGSLVIENIVALPAALQQLLLHTLDAQLICLCHLPELVPLGGTAITPLLLQQATRLQLPALGKRQPDIPLLVRYFSLKYNYQHGCPRHPDSVADQVLAQSLNDMELSELRQATERCLEQAQPSSKPAR